MTAQPQGRPVPQVRPARPDQLDAATRVLCAALADDPGWTHVVPDRRIRAKALRALIGTAARDASNFDSLLVAEVDGRVAGAAVWLPPGAFPMSWQRRLRGVPPLLGLALHAAPYLARLARFGSSLEAAFPAEPAWYLEVLGVAPYAQRRGIGGALVGPVLERADREGAACYLETAKPENVDYYRASGFGVVNPGRPLFDGGPPIWTMLRPAAR